MVVPWRTPQSRGERCQSMHGCGLRPWSRSELLGHFGRGRPAIGPRVESAAGHGGCLKRTLSRVHARSGCRLGSKREGGRWQCDTTSRTSRGGAPRRSCRGSARTGVEGVLKACTRRKTASADSQRCSAFRIRAGVIAVPSVPGRSEKRGEVSIEVRLLRHDYLGNFGLASYTSISWPRAPSFFPTALPCVCPRQPTTKDLS